MRIVKIKNKNMIVSDEYSKDGHKYSNEEKKNFGEISHFYAMYYDKKTKEHRAIPLTHLYVKDAQRFGELRSNKLQKEWFSHFEDVPSGVRNYYYTTDVNGKKFSFKSTFIKQKKNNRSLNKKQAERIKKFAKTKKR